MPELRVTELDFETIKTNLKNFMKNQSEFTDFDFDGAGLNVLLDVLAYNTHYNAMMAHLMSNEMFIDTAIKRSSIVSIAKTLGYVPRSYSASRAVVSLTLPASNSLPVTVGSNVKFTASINGSPYTFNVEEGVTVTPEYTGSGYQVTFPAVKLIEGTRLQNSFVVTTDNKKGPFVIPVKTVDLSTVQVLVQKSSNEAIYTVFTETKTVIDITDTSNVFWIEENSEGNYQVVLGDGVIGASLVEGNIVTINYIACNGSTPNNIRTFTLNGPIGGTYNVTVTTVSGSTSGAEKETIDEIRFNAPKYNTTKNRAVTADDYKALIMSDANINYKTNSIAVWGGETNVPPIYGKVFICIDPTDEYTISESDKNYIINDILRPRSIMSIQHEVVDPEYTYVGFEVSVTYNPLITNYTTTEIEAMVKSAISDFFANNLSTLDKTFFYSQLIDDIAAVNPSIVGVLADMWVQKRIVKELSFNTTKNLRFSTSLQPETLKSTVFVSTVSGLPYDAYMRDFTTDEINEDTALEGTIQLLEQGTDAVLVSDLGTVNYGTGVVSFSDLNINAYLGNITDVRITAKPKNLSKNISPTVISATTESTSAVTPVPSKNIIIRLDDSEINNGIGLSAGLSVAAIPFIQKR